MYSDHKDINPVFENMSKVNIWYYTGMRIGADIICSCVLVAFLNVDLCKRTL